MDKLGRNILGYEEISGRYATYFLGYIFQNKHKDLDKAKAYYAQCVTFAKATNEANTGYGLYAF